MLFDLNGFLGPWPFWQVRHQTPKSVLTLMDRHGIDVLAVCATRSILSDWKLGNEETIQAATHNPNRFVAFVSISPILPASELVRQLESYKRAGVKGIRLYPQHQSYSLTGLAGSSVILQKAQELSLSVVLPIRAIMQWGLPELDTGTIEAVVTRHPRLTFILSGVNYSKTLWAYDLVRRRHNVSLEISGMQGFRALEDAVHRIGAEKILFGSGLPLLYPACSLAKLASARITRVEKEAISGGNARRLLRMN